MPAAIAWPKTTEETARILAYAYQENIPVTPWGAGTSTEGNPVPTRGGLVVDLTQMDRIVDIRPQDLQADVQPGVFRKELNRNKWKQTTSSAMSSAMPAMETSMSCWWVILPITRNGPPLKPSP